MDVGSVSQQLNNLLQKGGGSVSNVDLSAKGLVNIAQQGMQSAESFNKDLTGLLKASGLQLGSMPSIPIHNTSFSGGSLDGIKQMGKHFLDTTNASLVIAQKEQEKVLTGESSNINQSILSAHEANTCLSVVICFANKLQEFYKTVVQTQV